MPQQEGKIGRVSYAWQGAATTQEAVVFLNGVMASANSWASYVRAVSQQGFATLTHDFRGQWLSEKPPGPYTFATHVEDLFAILDALQIKAAHLVGTSYGGEVGLKAAIMKPSRVKSLVLINAASELDAPLTLAIKQWIDIAQQEDGAQFFEQIVKPLYHPDFITAHPGFIRKAKATMAAMPEAYFYGQIQLYETFLSDLNLTGDLGRVHCPTLVVCGAEDVLKPPYFSERIARGITDAERVLIPDCGHVTLYETPNILTTLILGFLGKHREIDQRFFKGE
ncbi:MAG: alpha/beta fold hydrolase [Acholeplasmatales bacterium]|nr:MAG: alpha/beta fold hydrolase [Acholeplasmatales bacterium]